MPETRPKYLHQHLPLTGTAEYQARPVTTNLPSPYSGDVITGESDSARRLIDLGPDQPERLETGHGRIATRFRFAFRLHLVADRPGSADRAASCLLERKIMPSMPVRAVCRGKQKAWQCILLRIFPLPLYAASVSVCVRLCRTSVLFLPACYARYLQKSILTIPK